MLILHVNWANDGLRLWAESALRFHDETTAGDVVATHPFAASGDGLTSALCAHSLEADHLEPASPLLVRLPAIDDRPIPSDRFAASIEAIDVMTAQSLRPVEVPTVRLRNACAIGDLLRLEDRGPTEELGFSHGLDYWMSVGRFLLELLVDQRFIPSLVHLPGGGLRAAWRPWLHDEVSFDRLAALADAMPPAMRAAGQTDPVRLLQEALDSIADATVRRALHEEAFVDALAGRDPREDPHVAWLSGLLDHAEHVPTSNGDSDELLRGVQNWIGRLQEAVRPRTVRLGLLLNEPPPEAAGDDPEARDWRLSLQLMVGEPDAATAIDADRIWAASPSARMVDGVAIDRSQELLLAELGEASRLYPRLEAVLEETQPGALDLTALEAVEFMREYRPLLVESGFVVEVPSWWDTPMSRLGVRLRIESPDVGASESPSSSSGMGGAGRMGLQSIVRYRWELAVGDQNMSTTQLRQLVSAGHPLVRVGEQWVELGVEDIERAKSFLDEQPGGETTLIEALGYAQPSDRSEMPVLGMEATGWVGDLLASSDNTGVEKLPAIEQPQTFVGTLRPYQVIGLRWLVFLERFGFGACLADDMGLGKTIQLIALLLNERETADPKETIGPTLLIVPTSVIVNWSREIERFGPSLTYHIQHGPERPHATAFQDAIKDRDVVITTYALASRDRDTLQATVWRRVVLDEAQYIKNPPTKQTQSIRQLTATRRVALTGTPVENRLSELWSIMDFCNPGYLGTADNFRRRWSVPIERHRDRRQADGLRHLVRPFILRRLKTDPDVIADLPACVESKAYATLTAEQAILYQSVVDQLLARVGESEGIQRRGQVLAALVKLKQVCNHPAHFLGAGQGVPEREHRSLSGRSGKCRRLVRTLEEVFAANGKALVFTQFRQMGHLLSAMIRHDLDCETLFLHGGTPTRGRQQMIDRFQSDPTARVFILSLRAGGVGLNLTAANHVFHFDRWWNPAVENQATDRAFRIGQTRQVHVHKFVCVGTLEERIDQMLEEKTELASNVIGTGEKWMTELSTQDLREALRLRSSAFEVEP